MDAEYLKANVGEVLANGLTAVVLNQPEDSVDYLARWLLKYVENTKNEEQLKETLRKQSEEDKKQEEIDMAERVATEKAKEEKASSAVFKKKEFEEFLANATTFDGLYEGFVRHVKEIIGVTGVYVGLKESGVLPPEPKAEEPDEGDEPTATSDLSLQYIAANLDHEYLVGKRLRGAQGVTFDIFKDTAKAAAGGGEDEDEEDEGDETKKKVAEPVDEGPKTMHIPNVLMGAGAEKMHFWTLPKLGSYLSIRMKYDGCLNETTLDEAIEKETSLMEQKEQEEEEQKNKAEAAADEGDEGDKKGGDEGDEDGEKKEEKTQEKNEEAAEETVKEETEEEKAARELADAAAKAQAEELYLVSHLEKQAIDLAICMDTLADGRRFKDDEIAYVRNMVSSLNETVLRIDRTLFKEERIRRQALVEFNESAEVKSEEELQQELDRLKANLERAGTSLTTDADVTFKYRQNCVTAMREKYQNFRTFHVFRGPLEIIQALMFLMDEKKEDVSDIDGKPSWSKIRLKLDDEFMNKLQAYDPREPQIRDKSSQYAAVAPLRKMVSIYNMEEVQKVNRPLAELLGYIRGALAVKTQARQERKEQRRAEEEVAAKLAAEAAAAEKAAAEANEANEGDAGEGDAEEEKKDEAEAEED